MPNDAVKRRGAFEGVNPADLILWMALRATMPKKYKSKAELARIVGSDWNVVRAQLRNLEAHSLIRYDPDGIHTVIPDQDELASQEPTSKADPSDPQLDLRVEWNRALYAMQDQRTALFLGKRASLRSLTDGEAHIAVWDKKIGLDELEALLDALEEAFSRTRGHKVAVSAMYSEP